jgi:hypothetical protein
MKKYTPTMNRRTFGMSIVGFPFINILPTFASEKKFSIQPYRPGKTRCPIFRVTPDDAAYIHTFFDRSAISPSGRYVVCLRMPFQDRIPKPGEKADICVVDLKKEVIETIYSTAGWETQTAAHQQWGPSEKYIYFCDVKDNQPVTVRYNFQERTYELFDGPLYQISPDEQCAASVDLRKIGRTQGGYGVIVDPKTVEDPKPGAASDDGLWVTSFKTGKKKLLVNYAECFEIMPYKDRFKGGTINGFHVKFNRDGTRIQWVVRNRPSPNKYEPSLFTFKPDGSELQIALSNDIWRIGGHHPDWHPNGTHITHNLKIDGTLRFCMYKYDSSEFQVLGDESILGSGHPSFHKDGRFLVTDTYTNEPMVLPNKEVPIRWIDMKTNKENMLCSIWTFGKKKGVLRCDPHPAWSFDFKQIVFNGAPNNQKAVFIADVEELIQSISP